MESAAGRCFQKSACMSLICCLSRESHCPQIRQCSRNLCLTSGCAAVWLQLALTDEQNCSVSNGAAKGHALAFGAAAETTSGALPLSDSARCEGTCSSTAVIVSALTVDGLTAKSQPDFKCFFKPSTRVNCLPHHLHSGMPCTDPCA